MVNAAQLTTGPRVMLAFWCQPRRVPVQVSRNKNPARPDLVLDTSCFAFGNHLDRGASPPVCSCGWFALGIQLGCQSQDTYEQPQSYTDLGNCKSVGGPQGFAMSANVCFLDARQR